MPQTFETEATLCAAFLSVLPEGWVAYAETGGFDILLVREADGLQIGVQAKLRLNAKVVRQACKTGRPADFTAPNPDCRVILVPYGAVGADMAELCRLLGLSVIGMTRGGSPAFAPQLPRPKQDAESRVSFEWAPSQRIALPDYVPDVEAGRPAPVRLTARKIKAIRIAVTLERRGFVLREDFRHHKIDMRRWVAPRSGWLVRQEAGWGRRPHLPEFQARHPTNWKQIEAAYERWCLPEPGLETRTPF